MATLTASDLGRRIRDAREAAALSQQDLGTRIGVDRYAVMRMERGERMVSTLELVALADALDLPYSYFVERRDEAVTSLRRELGEDPEATERDRFRVDAVLDVRLRSAEFLRSAGVLSTGDVQIDVGTVGDQEAAFEVARSARRATGIEGPVPAAQAVAERFGLYIFVDRIPTDGASRSPERGFGVAVIRDSSEPGRRRATAVHELGHHLLGDAYSVDVGGASRSEREGLIDAFATEFLLPTADLRRMRAQEPEAPVRDFLIAAAAEYRVSWRLAVRTASRARLVEPGASAQLAQQYPTRTDLLTVVGREVDEDLRFGTYGPAWTKAVMRAATDHKITRARAEELLTGTDPFADVPPEPGETW